MAGMETWLAGNWFELLQTIILAAGLFATIQTLREDIKERKIQNLFTLNTAHRDIWSVIYDRPYLNRVLRRDIDLARHPVTSEEELFVHFLILHLRASFKARQAGMEFSDDAVVADIRQFFAQPIPRHVWGNSKRFQDPAFVVFVESHL